MTGVQNPAAWSPAQAARDARMNESISHDLEFCARRVHENDPWFGLHQVFAPKPLKPRILALHALFAMLERALQMSDEALTVSQLAWWRTELAPDQARHSAHPVIRALRACGALDRLSQDAISSILGQVIWRLQSESIPDEETLKSVCGKVGGALVGAEYAIEMNELVPALQSASWAGTGLSTLIHSAVRVEGRSFWFLPLTVQARHGCDAGAVARGTKEGQAALRTLISLCDDWLDSQLVQMREMGSDAKYSEPPISRHVYAWVLSDHLRAVKSLKMIRKGKAARVPQWRIREFLRVWSSCRRLSGR